MQKSDLSFPISIGKIFKDTWKNDWPHLKINNPNHQSYSYISSSTLSKASMLSQDVFLHLHDSRKQTSDDLPRKDESWDWETNQWRFSSKSTSDFFLTNMINHFVFWFQVSDCGLIYFSTSRVQSTCENEDQSQVLISKSLGKLMYCWTFNGFNNIRDIYFHFICFGNKWIMIHVKSRFPTLTSKFHTHICHNPSPSPSLKSKSNLKSKILTLKNFDFKWLYSAVTNQLKSRTLYHIKN